MQLALGELFSCARTAQGEIHCFGDNHRGQLGQGPSSVEPVRLPLEEAAIDIAAADDFACALGQSLSIYCWGADAALEVFSERPLLSTLSSGQNRVCGVGAAESLCITDGHSSFAANHIDLGELSVAQVAEGADHHCALTTAGDVYCFDAFVYADSNHRYRLGIPYRPEGEVPVPIQVPIQVPIPRAVAVASGEDFSCAVLEDGGVMCWGDNAYGALAGTTEEVKGLPVRIPGLFGVERIAAKGRLICAQGSSGTRCWGLNSYGQASPGAVPSVEPRRVELD